MFSLFADLLVDMLGVLASYNLTVRELKLFFSKLQGDKGQWVKKILNTLWYLKVYRAVICQIEGKSWTKIAFRSL